MQYAVTALDDPRQDNQVHIREFYATRQKLRTAESTLERMSMCARQHYALPFEP